MARNSAYARSRRAASLGISAPDILRFGFAPLFLRYQDVWRAADHLQEVLDIEEYLAPSFSQTATVT
jgi:kynureninase